MLGTNSLIFFLSASIFYVLDNAYILLGEYSVGLFVYI